MLKVTSYEVHETSDGQKFTALSVAQEIQARLNLAEVLGSEEWEESLGTVKVNDFITFLEQNREVVLDFFDPQRDQNEQN